MRKIWNWIDIGHLKSMVDTGKEIVQTATGNNVEGIDHPIDNDRNDQADDYRENIPLVYHYQHKCISKSRRRNRANLSHFDRTDDRE